MRHSRWMALMFVAQAMALPMAALAQTGPGRAANGGRAAAAPRARLTFTMMPRVAATWRHELIRKPSSRDSAGVSGT